MGIGYINEVDPTCGLSFWISAACITGTQPFEEQFVFDWSMGGEEEQYWQSNSIPLTLKINAWINSSVETDPDTEVTIEKRYFNFSLAYKYGDSNTFIEICDYVNQSSFDTNDSYSITDVPNPITITLNGSNRTITINGNKQTVVAYEKPSTIVHIDPNAYPDDDIIDNVYYKKIF